MNKLVALPVSGDAYLLQRRGRNILVDGGYGSRALISALKSPGIALSHIDIVVCTHADKDHAGGLTELLPSITVGEFWLPGAWSDSLPDLLKNPQHVVDALLAELDDLEPGEAFDGDRHEDDDEFESRVHSRIAKQRRELQRQPEGDSTQNNPGQPNESEGLGWLANLAENVDLDAGNDRLITDTFNRGRRRLRYYASKKFSSQKWVRFWVGLIDTAERIRKIAVLAIRHRVKVRWFDFGEYAKTRRASGGEPGLLVPLNSVELTVPPPPLLSMFYSARLTPVNEECLVLYSPGESPDELGVVFTGDSPLGAVPDYSQPFFDAQPACWPGVVATAPHHGSESNAAAYSHLEAVMLVTFWLRSGGSSRHPGATFRSLDRQRRGCTHCPHQKHEREVAEIQLSGFFWNLIFRVRAYDCSC
ncbi:MBL fold metallo-hydrolase [Caballeronia zhejiangensis]|uniref:MBL fold metallo-hydrolase n=1 Tax=Caballeronia zhejiangensis TaxID=871203 RepID=UPI00094EAA49|nr:MBL fold metallo-hydrolase [Caballeronia zhejiangensis]